MGCYGDLMGCYGDLMGCYGDFPLDFLVGIDSVSECLFVFSVHGGCHDTKSSSQRSSAFINGDVWI